MGSEVDKSVRASSYKKRGASLSGTRGVGAYKSKPRREGRAWIAMGIDTFIGYYKTILRWVCK